MIKLLLAVYHRNPAWAVVMFGAILLIAAGIVLIWQACKSPVPFLFWMGVLIVVVGAVLAFTFWVAGDFKEDD